MKVNASKRFIRCDASHIELTIPAGIELSGEGASKSIFRIRESEALMLFAKTKV